MLPSSMTLSLLLFFLQFFFSFFDFGGGGYDSSRVLTELRLAENLGRELKVEAALRVSIPL
jgi:hypothetical protein